MAMEITMTVAKPLVTRVNLERLQGFLDSGKSFRDRDHTHLEVLSQKLESVEVVPTHEIPRDVVTMNSQVAVRDRDASRVSIYTLMFPGSGDISKGKLSVLDTIGTVLLGSRAGALIDWRVPGGSRRFRVEEILYQPEAARKSEAEFTSTAIPTTGGIAGAGSRDRESEVSISSSAKNTPHTWAAVFRRICPSGSVPPDWVRVGDSRFH